MSHVLVVGSVALDSVKTPFGEVKEALGGSAVHFSAAASLLTELQLVGVVGRDFPEQELDFLKKRKVDCSGLEICEGRTFRWAGEYGFDLSVAKTLDTQLNVFANFSPKIPQNFRTPSFLFLANIHPDLQRDVLTQVKRPRLVALDTMNFWIECALPSLKKTISEVDLVVINEGEARELVKESFLKTAARKIQGWGPKTVVIKQGEYGALLFHGDQIFSAPGLPLESVKDPTGAGDSFAGGLMGYIASQDDVSFEALKKGVIYGSAMASYNVEAFSCQRLKEISKADVESRVEQFRKLAQF